MKYYNLRAKFDNSSHCTTGNSGQSIEFFMSSKRKTGDDSRKSKAE